MDERPSGSGRLEETVEKKKKLDERAQKAIIGYARLDLIENETELRFATWNPRPLKQEHVKRLVQSFLTKGADRFSYIKAIPLVVDKSDLQEKTYATEYKAESNPQSQLPLLKLAAEARGKRLLIAAGGQHRLHAVVQWQKMLRKQHAELAKERKTLEEADIETVTPDEIQNENKTQKPKRDALEETLSLGGQWMVVLYDTSKCSSLSFVVQDGMTVLRIFIPLRNARMAQPRISRIPGHPWNAQDTRSPS